MSGPNLRYLTAVLALCYVSGLVGQRVLYAVQKSEVSFVSDAPLERITASSRSASGILDIKNRDFVVRIPMRSFAGFNSPAQSEHFQENYVESRTWQSALFEGRIIENTDLSAPGTYAVRAKGKFTMHGVSRERIIPCDLVVSSTGLRVTGRFDVALAEHGIRIPRIVQQKLAANAQVKVDLLFGPSSAK